MRRGLLILALTVMAGARPSLEDQARAAAIARLPRASYSVAAIGGMPVSYLYAGASNGQLVLFIHGSPGSANAWSDYLLHVPPGFRFVAVDRLGFGHTAPGVPEPSLARQAAAIGPLLPAGQRAIVVGHSLGGPIAAQLAADYPDRVSTLIILAGSLDPGQEKIAWYNRLAEWPLIHAVLPMEWRTSNRELLPLKGELEKLGPQLEKIHARIVIVHGMADNLVPVANVAYMRPRFAHAAAVRTILIQDQNHFLPWEQKPLIDRLIEEAGR